MGFLNSTLVGVVVLLTGLFLFRLYSPSTTTMESKRVIVIGGGLAGMSAALEAHKLGAEVVLLEKEPRLGGNSAKASSGINAVGTPAQHTSHSKDTPAQFTDDTLKSGGGGCVESLVDTIISQSSSAVSFLTSLGVDLSVLSKCGGHSHPRTHRAAPPAAGQPARNIGFEITSKLIDHLGKTPVQIITGARVQKLIKEGNKVVGVAYQDTKNGSTHELRGSAVVLASGGFAADRTQGGLLEKHGGTKLSNLPTTNGPWATGDGVRLAEAVGAKMVLMDQVQIHPTGFVDPKDPSNPTKFLAPEALRAVGGILINKEGRRFADELSLRNQLATAIFAHGDRIGEKEGKEEEGKGKGYMAAYMLLNDEAVEAFGAAALKFYMSKGFIVKYSSVDEFTTTTGVDKPTLLQTLSSYNEAAAKGGPDEFGKTTFPVTFDPAAPINVLIITPSIHYTMGGALITPDANVMGVDGNVIPGLYAAGEASGGVHGNNRLAGNSLLECVVFGRIAGANAAKH